MSAGLGQMAGPMIAATGSKALPTLWHDRGVPGGAALPAAALTRGLAGALRRE
jgi:hypothetical protein